MCGELHIREGNSYHIPDPVVLCKWALGFGRKTKQLRKLPRPIIGEGGAGDVPETTSVCRDGKARFSL